MVSLVTVEDDSKYCLLLSCQSLLVLMNDKKRSMKQVRLVSMNNCLHKCKSSFPAIQSRY